MPVIGRAKGIPSTNAGAWSTSAIGSVPFEIIGVMKRTFHDRAGSAFSGFHSARGPGNQSSAATVSPILAGESATVTPTSFNAATLDFASPSPPLMMAPACPMRLPGGAV